MTSEDGGTTMTWAKLNVFQRLTRQWDSLHPYNAAQAMKLAGRANHVAIKSAWKATLREMGLGMVHVAGSRFAWDCTNQDWCKSGVIPSPPGATLDQHMTGELNRRFDDSEESPFRAFVIEAESDSHYVGVVYHHWVADSYSIRVLLREWFKRMYDPAAARRLPLNIATEGYWRLFGPGRCKWNLGAAALEMARWGARFRRARRIDPPGMSDFGVHFTLHHAPEGLIDAIVPAARRMNVTVNDVFLAAMAQVCDELVPLPRTRRRHDLAMGTIVDLRARLHGAADERFGMFLGFTSVFCRPEELANFDRLLSRVHQQNDMHKTSCAAQASMTRMLAGLVVARMFRRRRLLEFYRKRLSLAGGISNVNLNRDWPACYHPSPLLQYIRVSPCGPMMPVVFTPTTLGKSLNFGLTCRGAVIPPAQAPHLATAFISRLVKFAEEHS